MKRKVVECLATGFYIGKIPRAPGTFGTLLGIPVVLALKLLPPVAYLFATLGLVVVAILVAQLYEAVTEQHDLGEVVIDEIVGYAIAMTWLPATVPFFIAAFVVFRFFDIVKPPPIRQLDEKIGGGLGTILDDVAAGLVTNVLLQIVFVKTNWLGEMWDGTSL